MKFTITYILIIFSLASCAQSRPVIPSQPASIQDSLTAILVLEKFVPGNFSFMDVDVLDNAFVLTETSQLRKINNNGDSIAAFNDVKKYGTPSKFDVSNPLKILLYYRNFSTIVMLDRLLTFRNSLNLRTANIFNVKALGIAYDNHTWIFDEQDFKLKKINDDGAVLMETTDWRTLFPIVPLPTEIIDRDNFVYLYDSTKGFYVFDRYGSFKNQLPIYSLSNISIHKNLVRGFVRNNLMVHDLTTGITKYYTLPALLQDYISIKAGNGKLYALKKQGLEIYRIQ